MVRGSKKYKDIPIYAAPGLHEECFAIISDVCQQGAKIFDIAAGAGAFAARLKDANYCVYANDIDSKSWKAKEIPKTSFDLNNSVKGLFPDAFFDLVVAMEVIEHLENPRKLLLDCKRLTKPGGYILLSTPNITDAASRAIFLRKGLFYHFSPNSFMQTGHMTILPYWLLEILIRSVNLEIALFKFGGGKERSQNIKGLVFSLITNFLHVFMKSSQHNELKSNYIIYLLRKGKN